MTTKRTRKEEQTPPPPPLESAAIEQQEQPQDVTPPPPPPLESAQMDAQAILRLAVRADEAIDNLAQQIAAVRAKIAAEDAAIEQADMDEEDVRIAIEAKEREIAEAHSQYKAARAVIPIVEGSPAEGEARAHAAEMSLQESRLQREIAELRASLTTGREAARRQRADHETNRARLAEILAELTEQRANMVAQKERFIASAGDTFYTEIEGEIAQSRARVSEQRDRLAAYEQELQYLTASVPQRLQYWPALEVRAREELVPTVREDAATRAIRAKMELLDILFSDAREIRAAYSPHRRDYTAAFALGIADAYALIVQGDEQVMRRLKNECITLLNFYRQELTDRENESLRKLRKRADMV